MTTYDDTAGGPQEDPQTHLDTDPVNQSASQPPGQPSTTGPDEEGDVRDDPAHDAGPDEGWESEGGATPEGPATDT